MTNETSPTENRRRDMILCAVITALLLLPFLGKAFHIDDPMYLWGAQHISSHPVDFFGYDVYWTKHPAPVVDINRNPPGVSYLIAFFSLFTGFNFEPALHFFFILPAVAFVLGSYALASRMTTQPLLATMAIAVSPAFLVSSTNLMSDVLMLAFYVWAIELWLCGMEKDNIRLLVGSAILIAACAFTKYFGLSLIPLLIAHGLLTRRRAGNWMLPFAIPLTLLVAYDLYTYFRYGTPMFLDATVFASNRNSSTDYGSFTVMLVMLSYLGGCLAPLLMFTPFLWSKRGLVLLSVTFVASIALLLYMGQLLKLELRTEDGIQWFPTLQLALWITAGIQVLAIASSDFLRKRDATSWLLAFWISGTLVWTYLNWNVNARLILPLVPAACIVLVRHLAHRKFAFDNRLKFVLPLALAGALSLWVSWADYRIAAVQVEMAEQLSDEFPDKDLVRFQGHWGWQWYIEAQGFRSFNPEDTTVPVRFVMILPENNTMMTHPPQYVYDSVNTYEIQGARWVTTMSTEVGAGFYIDTWGPLPFAFGNVPPERFFLYNMNTAKPQPQTNSRN